MKKDTLSNLMKQAHKFAKGSMVEGDYAVRFKIALKLAWAILKKSLKENNTVNSVKESFLINKMGVEQASRFIKNRSVYAVLAETEKAYKVAAMNVYELEIIWLPKAVCL